MRSVAWSAPIVLSAFVLGCGVEVSTDTGSNEAPSIPTAEFGQPLTLSHESTSLEVTPLRILDPIKGLGGNNSAGPGERYFGLELKINNLGGTLYHDSPSVSSLMYDEQVAQLGSAIGGTQGNCDSSFGAVVDIPAGASKSGCILYIIKNNARPALFVYAVDIVFGGGAAEWPVPGAAGAAVRDAQNAARAAFE
jgi:hypothetical protein